MIELRERLEQTCQLARDNLKKVQFKQKTSYYKGARSRKFDVGGKRSCYYSQRKVINYYSNGKVRMK